MVKPATFDQYWQDTLSELSRYPTSAEIEPLPIRSTDFATAYTVRITSLGPYRLFGYLSIPNAEGPFPTIYYFPKYGSVLEPIPQGAPNYKRSRFVTFALGGRGMRNSDQPFAAMIPGLLTEGIDDVASYIFRGIVADAVRGLEYVLSRPEVDSSRVVGWGNDVGLIAAGLTKGLSHLVCTPALFHDTVASAGRTSSYPLEEINDYLHAHPERRGAVAETLSHFDLRDFAKDVGASTLILAEAPGGVHDSEALNDLTSALGGPVEVHDSENSSYKDGLFTEQWVTSQFGYDDVIVPETWQ